MSIRKIFQQMIFGRSEEIILTSTEIQKAVFPFDGNPELHWIIRDGEPWFYADIVCQGLTIANTSDAVASLDDDQRDRIGSTDTLDKGQRRLIVNESGLYALIFKSRKPGALKFQKWVTSEVLPSIRKTGSYTMPTSREEKYRKRIKGTSQAGKLRTKIADAHIRERERVFEDGGGISQVASVCNGFWHGVGFPGGSREARRSLGINVNSGNPWDYMSEVAMAMGLLVKTTVERRLVDEEKSGEIIPIEKQPDLVRVIAERYHDDVARELNGKIGVINHQRRGPILDVINNAIQRP